MTQQTSQNCAGMISAVMYNILATHDVSLAETFRRIYVEPTDISVEAQIHQANNFWRLKLCVSSSELSLHVRGALVECSMENWIRLFSKEVAPYVAKINPTLQ